MRTAIPPVIPNVNGSLNKGIDIFPVASAYPPRKPDPVAVVSDKMMTTKNLLSYGTSFPNRTAIKTKAIKNISDIDKNITPTTRGQAGAFC